MLNKEIKGVFNILNIDTDTFCELPDKYKIFNNINSVEAFDTYLNYINQGGFSVVVDFKLNLLYNCIELNKEYEYSVDFFKVKDLIEILELYKIHKSVLFLDLDWTYAVLKGGRLICRFGENVWKSYPVNLI